MSSSVHSLNIRNKTEKDREGDRRNEGEWRERGMQNWKKKLREERRESRGEVKQREEKEEGRETGGEAKRREGIKEGGRGQKGKTIMNMRGVEGKWSKRVQRRK